MSPASIFPAADPSQGPGWTGLLVRQQEPRVNCAGESPVYRLFFIIYTLAATVLAGSGVIAALTIGRVDLAAILIGAGFGAALAVPVAWFVAKQVTDA